MKSLNLFCLLLMSLCTFQFRLLAQNTPKTSIAVVALDAVNTSLSPTDLGNIVRRELEKLNQFQVLDKYDVNYLLEKQGIKADNCYGKMCLIELGRAIKAQKMITGAVENYGKNIIITLRLIDVEKDIFEKTQVKEFLNISEELPTMLGIILREMLGVENDTNVVKKLTENEALENTINNPQYKRLNLTGPRMGYTMFTGEKASILGQPLNQGGFDAMPLMFQFGYQFETQYLNEGKYQALFEFIPMITGIDQGYFIPSFTILNGLRNNVSGWEFAIGPTIKFINQSEGYYQNGTWIRKTQDTPENTPLEKRLDSRGDLEISTSVLIGVGKTFRSGRLNIPINVFFVPSKNGHQFGISVGFNAKK